MNSPLKEGNMSLKKLIAIVIHVNANLKKSNYNASTLASRHLPLYCEVLKMSTILLADAAVYWGF